jgi:serine/threonine-protein kinase HipA
MDRTLFVFLQTEQGKDILAGTLRSRDLRGKEIFSFEASKDWIGQSLFRHLDPDLGQFSGPQYLRDSKPNFGLFLDSSPDRWGRLLMKRREQDAMASAFRRPESV